MENQNESIKISLKTFILILIILAIIVVLLTLLISQKLQNSISSTNVPLSTNITEEEEVIAEEFDYTFLKIENQKENKIYSPLSIKYALKMLEEASNGETKTQISKVLGNKTLNTYTSNNNLSLANSFFVRDSFNSLIKQSFINTLKTNYGAELTIDSFENAKTINNWVNEKTFGIIPQIVLDSNVTELDFALVNALAIDMDWEEKFILERGIGGTYPSTEFLHEQRVLSEDLTWAEAKSKILNVYDIINVSPNTFYSENSELEISGMGIYATINNYDIINELGEENIKKIVSEEYKKFARGEEYDKEHADGDFPLSEDTSDEGIQKALDEFLPTYISELSSNYHKSGSSTDFSIYVDDDVKVFAKDLKEYNNTTLQYIGIMPTSLDLDSFIENINSEQINNYIYNLKDINHQNFNEGVATRIYGYIPKFNFEYNLSLMEDLKLCGITDVFDSQKADLSNMVDSNTKASINNIFHSANIEFTQDGITAAAATLIGGAGGGAPFDYLFDVPTEEIDITFDKPYMFLIIDKETKETFFVGTVYEPLLWEEEPEKDNIY